MANWNPWHGCRKYSEGCQNCYVYRIDQAHGKNAAQIFLNKDFDLPMRRKRDRSYVISPGSIVYTCFSSDFFLEDAGPLAGTCLGDDALASGSVFPDDYQEDYPTAAMFAA